MFPVLRSNPLLPRIAIARLRTDWAKDLHNKKLDQIVMLYAPDAVFLPPNGERITGRSDIRELTQKAMDAFTSDLTFQSMNMRETVPVAGPGVFRRPGL